MCFMHSTTSCLAGQFVQLVMERDLKQMTQLKTQINYRKHESPLHIPQRMTTSASPKVGNNPGTKGSNTPYMTQTMMAF